MKQPLNRPTVQEEKRYFGEPFKAKPIQKKNYADIIAPNAEGSIMIRSEEHERGYTGRLKFGMGTFFPDASNEAELIQIYRDVADHQDVDFAVEEITNEMFVTDGEGVPVTINLEDVTEIPKNVKDQVAEEFEYILSLMNFSVDAFEIFRRFYVDSKLYYYKVVDPSKTQEGIKELRMIDPVSIRKIKEVTSKQVAGSIGYEENILDVSEYYVYMPDGNPYADTGSDMSGFGAIGHDIMTNMRSQSSAFVLSSYAIAEINSGLFDHKRSCIKGFLHKTVKPLNDLTNLETHMIIYRVARAPERRVFYIDTGNLPPNKAQQYLNLVQDSYRREVSYDSASGRIQSDSKTISMHEDYWLPRSGTGKGTQVETLQGAQNLSQIEDIEYLQKKFLRSLNIPPGRFRDDSNASVIFGLNKENSPEEIKFQKFVGRLRTRFNQLFKDILGTQVVLKKILTGEQWWDIANRITFDYVRDSYLEDSRRFAVLQQKMEIAKEAEEMVGKYISREYVWREILKFTDEQIAEERKRMAEEKKEFGDPNEEL